MALFRILGLLVSLIGFVMARVALAQELPVDFSADEVNTNSTTGTMTATGNVIFKQGEMRLTADKVEYDRTNGRGLATGNVVFIDAAGNTHYTDTLSLEENFARAMAEPVISNLSDGSWVGADHVQYQRGAETTFDQSRFTPCDCDFKNGETPLWELNTSESRHDPEAKTIYHYNVTMHILSVPVMVFPYLSHPDWTVRRRSGLMTPRFYFSSDLGAVYGQPYYLVTGKTHDVQFTPYAFNDKGWGVETHYRQYWDESTLDARIYSGDLNTFKQERQSVVGVNASFDTTLEDDWRTKVKIQRASQDTFMRRYNFDEAEELRLSVLTEQIGNNHYSSIEAYDTQDLTSDRNPNEEPTVLPSVFHERYLETDEDDLTLRLRLSSLYINNDESTEFTRWSSELYSRKDVATDYGNFEIEGRLAGQYRDIETATNNRGFTGELGQGTISAGLGWSLPIVSTFSSRHLLVEPRAKFISTRANDRTGKIPNRDSEDFRLDEANLFLLHREQGEDFNFSNDRLNTGVSLSMLDPYLGDVTSFVGVSRRVSGKTPQGPNATTDEDRLSDILANLTIMPDSLYSVSMLGRYDPRDFFLNETQVDASLYLEKTTLDASYTQISNSYFDSADEETEELTLTAYQDLGFKWTADATLIYDLTNGKRKLSESTVGLNYTGGFQDCLTVSIGYTRDTESDRDIKPVDEVFILFTFKYLGSITSQGLS